MTAQELFDAAYEEYQQSAKDRPAIEKFYDACTEAMRVEKDGLAYEVYRAQRNALGFVLLSTE